MKNKINIFSDKKIKFFLSELFSDYDLSFMDLSETQNYIVNNSINIIVLNDDKNTKPFDFKKLKGNFLILSSIKNQSMQINNQLIKTPTSIDQIKTITENFGVLFGDYFVNDNDELEAEGPMIAFRGLFLIDKEGIVQHQIVNNLPLGRNVDEALRMVDALQHHEDEGEVCPANWEKGKDAMKENFAGVADYLSKH